MLSELLKQNIEIFKEKCKEITKTWQEKYFKPEEKKEKKELSEKAKKLQKIITEEADFECQEDSVLKIVGLIIDEDIMIQKIEKYIPYYIFSMIVLLKNKEEHSYPIGKPCLVYNAPNHYAIKMDGTKGNYLPSIYENNKNELIRIATDEEIKEFFDNFNFKYDPILFVNLLADIEKQG